MVTKKDEMIINETKSSLHQHFRKCMENGTEQTLTDVRMQGEFVSQ